MHEHVIANQQIPTQKFHKNSKTQKSTQNLKPRSQKCMNAWKK